MSVASFFSQGYGSFILVPLQKQHPSNGSDMGPALARGGKKYSFCGWFFFAGVIFAKGMQPNIKFFAFFLGGGGQHLVP